MLKSVESSTRQRVNLDGTWRFATSTMVGEDPWDSALPGKLEVAVPASYNDQFVGREIRDHVGWVWYQREVKVPATWGDERAVLRFDSATHEAKVYVNDTYVGGHVGSYTPFEIDVTELVKPGESFRLTVGVNNELTNTTIPPGKITVLEDGRRKQMYFHDFYNYAGLARSVYLLGVPNDRVEDVTVTTDYKDDTGTVNYSVTTTAGGQVRVQLLDEAGKLVATAEGAEGTLTVPDFQLWQPGAAYLYNLVIEVVEDGSVVDSYPMSIGIRKV